MTWNSTTSTVLITTAVILLAGIALATIVGCKINHSATAPKEQVLQAGSVYKYDLTTIDGQPLPLSRYEGKAMLVVNVASKCGFTKQYAGLQELYTAYEPRGLVILGIPANDFGNQEPGTEAEIQTFCSSKYGVTFPMSSKLVVTGADKHPLYKDLTEREGSLKGEVGWNFTKFLLDRHGRPIARFGSATKPDDPKLLAAIDAALSEK